ncbi:MAG: YggS family pyridoxal phosphate-dependent enzyme [Ignavibacteria bacterium]|nr:YggS family pyridoxal phosphate-dependent enzyme [Ignavibacteria bacterium]
MNLDFIRKNYVDLKSNIKLLCQKYGRDENEIRIVAVSKTFSPEYIIELLSAGHTDFGENRVQELISKKDEIKNKKNINWHLVGHLQTNKVKYIIDFIKLIHSVDSYKLALEINNHANKIQKVIEVLVQVNTSGESQKSGIEPEEAARLCKSISVLDNIKLRGLMTIGMLTEDEKIIRNNFRCLKNIYDELKTIYNNFNTLSMGMTSDYQIAIEEGSNMIRVGSALFGKRIYN